MTKILFWLLFVFSLSTASPAWAVQAHGAPEGLYIHQIAHIFFACAMGIFMYWLRAVKLLDQPGWRMIRYCALLLLIWNVVAFSAHFLDENLQIAGMERVDVLTMNLRANTSGPFIPALYYFLKMDHLWCVPGMAFLYAGLSKLLDEDKGDG